MVATLIDSGASAGAADGRGNTPLHVARTDEMVNLLVTRGANVNALNRSGETPLWRSVAAVSDRGLAKALLDTGATPDLAFEGEAPEIAYAFEREDVELIRMLAAHGAYVDAFARETWQGETNKRHWSEEADKVETQTHWEGSLLFKAVWDDDVALAAVLLDLGASPDRIAWNRGKQTVKCQASSCYRFTHSPKSNPLMLAIERERVTLVERMLDRGANANAFFHDRFEFPSGEVTQEHYGPLWRALQSDNTRLASALLERVADVNALPCILHDSAAQRNVNAVRHLIQAGIDVDAPCPRRMTALGIAIGRDEINTRVPADELRERGAIVEALVRGGAAVNRTVDGGRSALHAAVKGHFGSDPDNLRSLVEAGADVNEPLDASGSLLHVAVGSNGAFAAKVQVLIDACADLTARDDKGRTALQKARSGPTDIVSTARANAYRESYDLLKRAKRRQRQLGCE